MKLKYIANARIPTEKAHGYQICKMCEEFVLKGVEVELIIPKVKNEIKSNISEYYNIKQNFKIKKIFCFDLVQYGYLGFWMQRLSFLFFAKIYLWRKKCEVLYTRDEFLGLFFKNYILELHSISKRGNIFYKKLFKKTNKIIVLTKMMKDEIIKNFKINKNIILVSPDGVDFEKFNIDLSQDEARVQLDLPKDKKIILYTGHLYDWKGVQILAKASKKLAKNCMVYFVGGMEKDINEFKQKNIDNNKIIVVGYRSYKEIPIWLKAADVLVLSNSGKEKISSNYTSPLKLFEYMSSGRPIVASNLPSIREILNQDNAVLFESDNSDSLAVGVKKVLSDNKIKNLISKKAIEDVLSYTWVKRTENIIEFIKK